MYIPEEKEKPVKSVMNGLRMVVLAIVTLGLVACGGGGGGESGGATAPAAPTLALTPQSIKTFHFSWTDVSDESEYRLLENPDGSSDYTMVAILAANTTHYDHAVFLPGRINARYILRACNSTGCTDSAAVSVSGTLATAIGYVKASNTDDSDYFGCSVTLAADGNTMAVGASLEDSSATGINGNQADNSASTSGAVYVFIRNGSTWSQQAYVKASNTETGDQFGYSVALAADGNTLAVGATYESSSATGINGNQADNSALASGAVYVFIRSGSTWSQQAYVKASNTETGDMFGYRLALAADGNTLVVGAAYESSSATGINGNQADNSAGGSGAVYVFTRSGTTWNQQAYVKASNTDALDLFGHSVALAADGNTLAVGAFFEQSGSTGINGNQSDNSAIESGAVYVFTRSGTTWGQQAYVKGSNTEFGDHFGYSVALAADGNTLAVGATYESSSATGVGSNQIDNSANASGAVYVFTRSGTTWNQQAYVKASNTDAGDYFGCSVAITADGNTLAVGAYQERSNATGINSSQVDNSAHVSGAVYVFTRSGTTWSQQAYVKASNTDAGDYFGFCIDLAAEGNLLAVGAFREGSSATGINGNQSDNSALISGAVYLY